MRRGRALDPDGVRQATTRISPLQEPAARDLVVAASDINRVRIVRALEGGPLAAGDLASVLGRSAAATSQHLAVLRRLGVVSAVRAGNVVRYRLTESVSSRVMAGIARAFDLLGR